jgi:hypothetical protein
MGIRIDGAWFKDEYGRILLPRGVNLGGSTKMPYTPDGRTHIKEGFYDYATVSFVGRPFPLKEADEHFSRLRAWGLTFLRFLVTWEAIEHKAPGEYDTEYLDYVRAIVDKAHEYGMTLFIDPHQDVWSRWTGGDGAPAWTLELLGFDIRKLHATHAAITHQEWQERYPVMVWASNYNRLAAATLFSVFFGGNDFAPHTKINGVSAQDFLQEHYFKAMQQLARKLYGAPNVIGYDTMNEPSAGYIGFRDLSTAEYKLRSRATPTPYQAMLLGSGYAQTVDEWQLGAFGNRKVGEVTLSTGGTTAWRDGFRCIWRENGVWDVDSEGRPHLLRSAHFATADGKPIAFVQDYLRPFVNRYAQAIREVDPNAIIFFEADALGDDYAPRWEAQDAQNIAFAPHWYDGLTLFTKRYLPFAAFDTHSLKIVFGTERVRASFISQLRHYKDNARQHMGEVPTLIGEIGIPYDMNGKLAYKTGDFSAQEQAMDASMRALEANLLPFTLWNYTADNSNERGDGWNGEDLSIFSRDQQHNPNDIHSGGRALKAVVRPYARAVAGTPIRMAYDMQTGVFEFVYKHDRDISAPTELFIPSYQYPNGYNVEVSDGTFEIDTANQRLLYRHSDKEMPHFVRVSPSVPRPKPPQRLLGRVALGVLVFLFLRRLFRRR